MQSSYTYTHTALLGVLALLLWTRCGAAFSGILRSYLVPTNLDLRLQVGGYIVVRGLGVVRNVHEG